MTIHQFASNDFERAYRKAFWRKVTAWLTKEPTTLLPFHDVRERMPIKGQHYLGLQQVPINRIVGSLGRYKDFDRVFLPRQTHTRNRWINVDRAHYEQVILPPVELIKMGELYFVKDGNHRVSVAREWEQEFIDAYVTEMVIPVPLTPKMNENDLELVKELAIFLDQTQLEASAVRSSNIPGQYGILLEHISFHQWLLGEQRQHEVSFPEAAESWYTSVYRPLVAVIDEQGILQAFPKLSATDLYLWLVKYLWYLNLAYREGGIDVGAADEVEEKVAAKLKDEIPRKSVAKLVEAVKDAEWVESYILQHEKRTFLERTHLLDLRPEAQVDMTVIGQYDVLEKHISVHRWFLGEQRQGDVPVGEATASWYDNIYLPLIHLIKEQNILEQFPRRTQADLYLWILEKQSDIKAEYDLDVSLAEAAQVLADEADPDVVEKSD